MNEYIYKYSQGRCIFVCVRVARCHHRTSFYHFANLISSHFILGQTSLFSHIRSTPDAKNRCLEFEVFEWWNMSSAAISFNISKRSWSVANPKTNTNLQNACINLCSSFCDNNVDDDNNNSRAAPHTQSTETPHPAISGRM